MSGTLTLKVSKGQLALTTLPHGGLVFQTIDGVPSILQRIELRLLTVLGEDFLHPEVGLPVRQMVGVLNQDFIRGAVTKCLLQDPAINSVSQVRVTVDTTTPTIRIGMVSADIILVGGQKVTVATPPDTEVFY